MRNLLIILILAGILSACEKKIEISPVAELIIGNWSKMQSSDTIHSLEKVNSLPGDDYAIAFLENGDLKENKNSGWCGTPPISYSVFEGSWELQNDSTLFIESTYWGGDMTTTWRILEIDDDKISYYIVEYLYEDPGTE